MFSSNASIFAASACLVILAGLIRFLVRHDHVPAPARRLIELAALLALLSGLEQLARLELVAAYWPRLKDLLSLLDQVVLVVIAVVVWPSLLQILSEPSWAKVRAEIADNLKVIEELRVLRAEHDRRIASRTAQLQETTQRFDTVLRQSPISVFNQDSELRYTWIRNPPPSYPADALGRTDEEVLPHETALQMSAIKRRVMETGEARRTEIALGSDGERAWYDLTVEPLRSADRVVVGIVSAAVDMTDRKRNEQRLELLLREVSHRSKNLLAIVQAIARQSAAADSGVPPRFLLRLRALSVSHDLLIEADWSGVPLDAIVRAQVGAWGDHVLRRIEIDGPDVSFSPGATDSMGLALHELIDNAVRYGSLSDNQGRVRVSWELGEPHDRPNLVFVWQETGGPAVGQPEHSGFGRKLLEGVVGVEVEGAAKLEFARQGLRFELAIPAYHFATRSPARQPPPREREPEPARGRRA